MGRKSVVYLEGSVYPSISLLQSGRVLTPISRYNFSPNIEEEAKCPSQSYTS
jgi:hypothetical protein